MRSALYLFVLFVLIGVVGCSNLPNPDAVFNTPTVTPANVLVVSAPSVTVMPTVPKATATVGPTRTPHAAGATQTPLPPATLVIEGQSIPLPDNVAETKNVPTAVREFASTQFRGLTRLGGAHAYLLMDTPDGFLSSFSSGLTAQGWENVPMQTGLPTGMNALIAQKGTIRATYILYSQENARTVIYVVLTQR